MLNFNYTLDNELTAPVGQLPSGIQTQAFGLAISRMMERFHTAVQVLQMPVRPGGVGPMAGMDKVWQQRLKAEIAFMLKMPNRLISAADSVATHGIANAVDQGRLDSQWNRWSQQGLKVFGEAIDAFQREVSAALMNKPVTGVPAAMVKLANIAKVPAPVLLDANGTLGGYPVDDPAYLADMGDLKKARKHMKAALKQVRRHEAEMAQAGMMPPGMGALPEGTPLLFGALAGVSLVGLAAWYFTRGTGADRVALVPPPSLGYYY
jgi:hypothetical protein